MTELDEVFEALERETFLLRSRWKLFEQLYMTNDARVELMKHTASQFFAHMDRLLIDCVILSISRLSDPPKSVGRRNLSLETIVNMFADQGEKGFAAELRDRLLHLRAMSKKLAEHRNQRLAHKDFAASLSDRSKLPPIKYGLFGECIGAIEEFLNEINHKRGYSTVLYPELVTFADGDSLIQALQRGVAFDELCKSEPGKYGRLVTYDI